MKITNLLMEPFLQQLEQEFTVLAAEASAHESRDARELCCDIETGKTELANLQSGLSAATAGGVVPTEIHDEVRRIKLGLRFMTCRWLKILSNTERVRKMYARRRHVSTFAA